MDDIIVKVR